MRRTALICIALVSVTAAASLAARPAWPVDETRYLGVAWGMWMRGDFLVPRLNGALYTDKPPLLFWLMHAGWAVFGVNEWWPRLISPLSALLSLWLTARLARRLFPAAPAAHASGARVPAPPLSAEGDSVASLAPLLLCGSLLFAAWLSFLMFDMLLVATTLAALLGLLAARQDGGARGWLLCGLGLGAGFLVKGPVLLVHVLPVALAVRWWSPAASAHAPRGFRWVIGVAAALLLGVALALLWVIPAGLSGGPAYRDALLFGQAASRLANSTDVPHAEPFWFYVMMLPALLFPWPLWPRLWRAVGAARAPVGATDTTESASSAPVASTVRASTAAQAGVNGVRFLLAWALPALVVLSAIGSKQEQYLLPELPAFALLGAALLVRHAPRDASAARPRPDALVPGLLLAACGAAIVFAAFGWAPVDNPTYAGTSAAAGLALLVVGIGLATLRPRTLDGAATALSVTCAAVIVAVHLGAPPALRIPRDVRPAAARVASLQQEGRPLAFLGKYRAQYDFFGRLQQPLDVLTKTELAPWLEQHPDGVVVSTHESPPPEPADLSLRELDSFPSGEHFWERAARDGADVRSRGPR